MRQVSDFKSKNSLCNIIISVGKKDTQATVARYRYKSRELVGLTLRRQQINQQVLMKCIYSVSNRRPTYTVPNNSLQWRKNALQLPRHKEYRRNIFFSIRPNQIYEITRANNILRIDDDFVFSCVFGHNFWYGINFKYFSS